MHTKKFSIIRTFIAVTALAMSCVTVVADDTPPLLKFNFGELAEQNAKTELPYLEFMRVESMSGYIYELEAGATDEQEPHDQDEIYYVVKGRALLTVDDESVPVAPGDILFVKKFAQHIFSEITEDLQLLVVFAPPDTE